MNNPNMNRAGGKEKILVTGASGAQGGSVASFLLKEGRFDVRLFVRNPNKDKIRRFKEMGAEICVGNFDDPQSIRQALQGIYGVFLVTNFWECFNKELQQGKMFADCCREAGIRHLVFSGLENVQQMSKGKYDAPHFTLKAQIEEYICSLRNLPYTFVHLGFYMQNLKTFYPAEKQSDGTIMLTLPTGDQKLGWVNVDDIGGVVKEIFNQRDQFLGKTIPICSDCLSLREIADQASGLFKIRVKVTPMTLDQYEKSGKPHAKEMADMFRFLGEFHPYKDCIPQAKRIYPGLQSFQEWVKNDPLGWKAL